MNAESVRTMGWGMRTKGLDLNGKDSENRADKENARANKGLGGGYSRQKRRRTGGDTQEKIRNTGNLGVSTARETRGRPRRERQTGQREIASGLLGQA